MCGNQGKPKRKQKESNYWRVAKYIYFFIKGTKEGDF